MMCSYSYCMTAAARAPLLRANANYYAASLGIATLQLAGLSRGLTATAAAVSIPTKNTIVTRKSLPSLCFFPYVISIDSST